MISAFKIKNLRLPPGIEDGQSDAMEIVNKLSLSCMPDVSPIIKNRDKNISLKFSNAKSFHSDKKSLNISSANTNRGHLYDKPFKPFTDLQKRYIPTQKEKKDSNTAIYTNRNREEFSSSYYRKSSYISAFKLSQGTVTPLDSRRSMIASVISFG